MIENRGTPALVAITKADKVSRSHRSRRLKAIAEALGVPVQQCLLSSAITNEGIGDLVESIEALAQEPRNG